MMRPVSLTRMFQNVANQNVPECSLSRASLDHFQGDHCTQTLEMGTRYCRDGADVGAQCEQHAPMRAGRRVSQR